MSDADWTLEDWLATEYNRLAEFKRYWHDNSVAAPDEYPLQMSAGEWDEQYMAFEE